MEWSAIGSATNSPTLSIATAMHSFAHCLPVGAVAQLTSTKTESSSMAAYCAETIMKVPSSRTRGLLVTMIIVFASHTSSIAHACALFLVPRVNIPRQCPTRSAFQRSDAGICSMAKITDRPCPSCNVANEVSCRLHHRCGPPSDVQRAARRTARRALPSPIYLPRWSSQLWALEFWRSRLEWQPWVTRCRRRFQRPYCSLPLQD